MSRTAIQNALRRSVANAYHMMHEWRTVDWMGRSPWHAPAQFYTDKMQQHLFRILALILVVITNSAANSQCSTLLNNSNSSVLDFEDCGILLKAFEEALVDQYSNLFWLDQVFNPPSQISPSIVKVSYTINLTIHDDADSDCSLKLMNWTDKTAVLGWTSKSLYKNFDRTFINQVPLQVPYLVLTLLETFSKLKYEPYVNDFLWAGGEKRMPEVDLTLNKFNIRNLSVNLTEYQPFNYQYIYTLHDCPSDKIVSCALKELNQWVSGYYLVLDG